MLESNSSIEFGAVARMPISIPQIGITLISHQSFHAGPKPVFGLVDDVRL